MITRCVQEKEIYRLSKRVRLHRANTPDRGSTSLTIRKMCKLNVLSFQLECAIARILLI